MKIASYFLSRRTLVAGGTLACLVAMVIALTINGFLGTTHSYAQTTLPKPSHIVVVMEENHSYNEIINSSSAPYINSLAGSGASFTNSFAVAHPSEPNYLAFFSGSTQGITDDSCPHTFNPPDLGGELINAGLSFKGYSEGLPSTGSTVCTSGSYARKHNPWSNFTDVPSSDNLPFTSFPKSNFSSLPTVSFVIPNLNDDMHDGTIQQGDTWLKNNIDSYVQWAKTNNSLLIVTWDEDDSSQSNQIPTIFVGPMVKTGQYSEHINHYNVLRTMEDMYGLPAANNSASASAITDCWQSGVTPTPTPNPSPTATPSPMPSPTPTPTTTPTPTPTPTPSPTPSPTPTTTPTPTPTPTPGGGNILANGGFESGSSSWTESSSGSYEIVDNGNPHTGSNSAYLCGYNSCSDSIYQTVTMPSSSTKVTLSYWLDITTTETSKTTCYDNFHALLRTSSGSTISTVQTRCNTNAQGWTQFTFDVTSALSSYKGQQIQVAFTGTNDYTLSSSFYVDDVALTAQ